MPRLATPRHTESRVDRQERIGTPNSNSVAPHGYDSIRRFQIQLIESREQKSYEDANWKLLQLGAPCKGRSHTLDGWLSTSKQCDIQEFNILRTLEDNCFQWMWTHILTTKRSEGRDSKTKIFRLSWNLGWDRLRTIVLKRSLGLEILNVNLLGCVLDGPSGHVHLFCQDRSDLWKPER